MRTGTGNFAMGFRRGWSAWQRENLQSLAAWGKSVGFEALEIGWPTPADVQAIRSCGLAYGTADLLDFPIIMASDAEKRRETLEKNLAYVRVLSAIGVKLFLTVIAPGDPTAKRSENYKLAVECYSPIAEAVANLGGAIVIEGAPGKWPWYPNLGCTPESVRAILKDIPRGMALNFDPSHLIRLGVDHVRFLGEFAPHVKHVHAKDTAIDRESAYEFGTIDQSIHREPRQYEGLGWRYTLPGRGCVEWGKCFAILKDAGFSGIVSVELEDPDINGDEARERAALVESLKFLSGS